MTATDGHITASSTTPTRDAGGITFGWVVRRSALWLLIVAVGVSAACLLYAAASSAGSTAQMQTLPAAPATVGSIGR